MTDRDFQLLAIEEAKLSLQEKQPSLFVGVVVVRDGGVIAKAHRGQFRPGDHAEFTALRRASTRVRRGSQREVPGNEPTPRNPGASRMDGTESLRTDHDHWRVMLANFGLEQIWSSLSLGPSSSNLLRCASKSMKAETQRLCS
ncbi:MAG: hypothetical protein ACREA0_08655 [bacterium]